MSIELQSLSGGNISAPRTPTTRVWRSCVRLLFYHRLTKFVTKRCSQRVHERRIEYMQRWCTTVSTGHPHRACIKWINYATSSCPEERLGSTRAGKVCCPSDQLEAGYLLVNPHDDRSNRL